MEPAPLSETLPETSLEVPPEADQVSAGGEDLLVPDWLKSPEVAEVKKEPDIIPNPLNLKIEEPKKQEIDIEKETKIEELQVPDWLKGSFDDSKKDVLIPAIPTAEVK